MNQQYFASEPECESKPAVCSFPFAGVCVTCETDSGVFSRGKIDDGTALLLESLPELKGSVLDVGCGWGAIGVSIAKAYPECRVTMLDVNHRALALSEKNLKNNGASAEIIESDGLSGVKGRIYDFIVTNPPIRTGKQVIYKMFADAAGCLNINGSLYLVIRKQQGGDSCMKYLQTIFSSVEKINKSAGYWIIRASHPKNTADY